MQRRAAGSGGGEPPAEPVFQLGYVSVATEVFSDADLVALLDKARSTNFRLGVTGMLLYHDGAFIQVLEGKADAVLQLYDRIKGDPRHTGAVVLFQGMADRRSFPVWTMGFHRPANPADMPAGLNKFLEHGVAGLRPGDGDRAREALNEFRYGRWSQTFDDTFA